MGNPATLPADFFSHQEENPATLPADFDFGEKRKEPAPTPGMWGQEIPEGLVDPEKFSVALVSSHMLGVPASVAYQNEDLINESFIQRGVEMPMSMPNIAKDIKVGLQGSIAGLASRNKMPEVLKDPNMADRFVEGLSQMVADLPFYIGGAIAGASAGGAVGTAVPVIGNVAGAVGGGAMGTFAVPDAIRESLVLGIEKGDIKSFGDLMDRTLSVFYAGEKGALTGLATEAAGAYTLAMKSPAAQAAMKKLQQATVLTLLPKLMEGKMPTAEDFAVNTALLVAMHYSMAGIEKAGEIVPKVQSRNLKEYAKSGTHPAAVAAEALRQAQESPTEDVMDRVNEITRKEAAPEAKEPAKSAEQAETVVPEPTPASLRPAIKAEDGKVTPGGEGEVHPDIVERSKDGERGFVDRNDQFHTRDEAKAWLRENEPEVYRLWEQVAGGPDEEFHTTDYNEARRRSTGVKNAAVDVQREQMGLPPIETPMRSLDPDNWEQAKSDVDSGRIEPLAIAESINKNPRGMSPEETNALNYYSARLSNDHKAAMDSIEKARENDDPKAELAAREKLQRIEDRINTVDEATKRAGTEWGSTGKMRQRMVKEDYSLDRLLQRARVASPTGEVPAELRDKLETLTRQLEDANKKVELYQTRLAEREAERAMERMKQEVSRSGRKAARKVERIELSEEFDGLVKQFDTLIMGRMSANPMFDPEVIGILGKMAKNRLESGLTRIEDIVDDIHAKLTDLGHDVTKRDIRDAISGYGKTFEMSKEAINVALREAKRQGKLISALEDAQAALLPLRSGLQRDKASDRVRELQQQVKQAMRESGIDVKSSMTPEQQWKTALDGVKTRLRNQITDLTKQLRTGEKTPKREGITYDEEANVLKAERDSLRSQLQAIEGKPKMSPEQKLKMAMAATEKSISEYERRIKENDLTPQQRKSGMAETPELRAMRERRDALRETFRQMKEAANPKKSPEEVSLDRYKKVLTNRIADMERQLETEDFTKEPHKPIALDPEATDLKVKSEKLRRQIDEALTKQKLASRTKTQKAVDIATKWRRAGLLTGWTTLGKLTKAAMDRMGVTPVEEMLGGVLSHIPGVDEISARAPMHGGGLNVSAEVKAVSQLWQKATAQDMWEELAHGEDSLDLLFGGKSKLPPEVLGLVGQLHGALKVPEKRAEFFRRLEIGMEYAKRNNLDVGDPRVQSAVIAKIESRAYDESLRAILMQKNVLTDAYQVCLSYLRNRGGAGQAIESGARIVFPMVRIATNLPAETIAYTPAGLAYQTVQIFRLLADENRMGKSALDNLSMHDMDNVMRGLKKGSVGLALMAIGFGFRKNITGYYTTEEEKKRGVKRGVMKVGGITIPAYLNDSPPLMAIQFAATIGHVWDHFNMKGMSGGLIAGAVQATEELGKRVPFYGEIARTGTATETPEKSMVNVGEFLGSMAVPRIVSQIAEATDKQAQQRKAETAMEAIKLQVPGLRETVPVRGRRHTIRKKGY